jgi:alpha-D-xyloside xylohydrolase
VGGLPAAVSALINLSASGFPSFASDTGGYRGGRPTREALLRWAEHSALAPYMQLGGGGESHNPWSYDAEATVIYRTLARLHDGLIPYWRSLAIAASTRGTPPIRALALSFPQDSGARSDPYAYLLGDDLYAVPVIEPGVTRRRVHIPPGRWVHWFTRVSYEGPRDEMLDAPLGQPLLFLRHGAVVPMLAEDVVTLASTDDATIVDAEDRRMVLRARIVPGEERASSTHDGARIVARSVEGVVSVRWTPGSDATELRAQIDWANRAGATGAAPTSVVLTGGTAVSQAPSLDDARQGRCAPCWAYSEASGELYVTVRGAAAWSAQ